MQIRIVCSLKNLDHEVGIDDVSVVCYGCLSHLPADSKKPAAACWLLYRLRSIQLSLSTAWLILHTRTSQHT